MWPSRVSNPGPLTYESGALPTALRGQARDMQKKYIYYRSASPSKPQNTDIEILICEIPKVFLPIPISDW